MSSRDIDTVELQKSSTYQGGDGGNIDAGHLYPNIHSEQSGVYQTRYQKSLRHYLTREALPQESHYRNLSSIVDGSAARPTLDELRRQSMIPEKGGTLPQEEEERKLRGKVIKFGWLEGVLMRCLLNIWGVMLFLRVSWVVGEAGLIFAILVVTLANIVTVVTTMSMSAVATNGAIKAGGIYYMISRSLGPEFGGSIGLMFTLANSIAAATYIIGFVNSLQDMCKDYFDVYEIIPGANGGVNDVRILGTITLILVLALAIVGMDWVTRVQMGLLFVLIGSQIDFIIGAFMGPADTEEEAKGYIGFNSHVWEENIWADFRYAEGKDQSFFGVFGVFFPAVTGIVAGANLSGDLKDPSSAIPKGTLIAIVVTFITYIIYPFMLAGAVVRDAYGNVTEYELNAELFGKENPYLNPTFMFTPERNDTGAYCHADENGVSDCFFGSQNNFQVMELVAAWGPLIYIGCYAATLSSAIASLVGAPRVLQALAKDRLYPHIHFFEKGWGANNDPVRGYVLVFVISFACIMVGDLNVISTLLTNFFLAAYALINFSCFHASFIKSPGWRPSFKFYNLWCSLFGGVVCLVIMFLIDWVTALITFLLTIVLYMYVSYRKPNVNWGSSTQAQIYVDALKSTLELMTVKEHVKNYRPQVLVMSGNVNSRPALVDFAQTLTKSTSLLACGNIIKGPLSQRQRNNVNRIAYDYLEKHKVKAFHSMIEATNMEDGAKNLFQIVGLGKLRPNMVLLGYKSDWGTCDRMELKAYFNTLHEALDMYLGLAILRIDKGLDYSKIIEDDDASPVQNGMEVPTSTPAGVDATEEKSLGQMHSAEAGSEPSTPPGSPPTERQTVLSDKKRRHSVSNLYRGIGGVELPKEVLNQVTMFQRKQKKGTIDVWWLYDDGGLTMLLPYILSTRANWANCKLRIFALANRKDELDTEQRSMANLLNKFRIDYSDVVIIPDMARKAGDTERRHFETLIKEFKTKGDEDISKENEGLLISEAELISQREKTNRHIRLRELLIENSRDASMIVMTLPIPRKTSVSAPLYMAWLETLTRDMPPFLLIRGNQQSVLTFYS